MYTSMKNYAFECLDTKQSIAFDTLCHVDTSCSHQTYVCMSCRVKEWERKVKKMVFIHNLIVFFNENKHKNYAFECVDTKYNMFTDGYLSCQHVWTHYQHRSGVFNPLTCETDRFSHEMPHMKSFIVCVIWRYTSIEIDAFECLDIKQSLRSILYACRHTIQPPNICLPIVV